jgi:hypothetical protein
MKMNFRRFVLTIYLLTLAVVAHTQVLKGTASGTVTDIDGRFELKDLKECNQKLVISYIFYRTAEIDGATYGGDKDDVNSGVLKFVRVEYTGYAFDEEHEANGITFYGAGKQGIRLRRGTQVEITSAKVTGKGKPLAVESAETENATLGYASLEDIAKECSWMNGWIR